ncbi:MAG: hypothetical protein HY262_00125 [Chloroflexi bacterium]|nr:hypothetical protein [Chloroflexota bacterium]
MRSMRRFGTAPAVAILTVGLLGGSVGAAGQGADHRATGHGSGGNGGSAGGNGAGGNGGNGNGNGNGGGNGGGSNQALPGSVPAWATAANRVGAADGSQQVNFRVYLPWRNAADAEALALAVSTPGNAKAGQFLTPQQFRDQFAPSQRDVSAVATWLKSSGFRVGYTPSNNHYVEATGTVAQAATAFSTTFADFSLNRPPSSRRRSRPGRIRPVSSPTAGRVPRTGARPPSPATRRSTALRFRPRPATGLRAATPARSSRAPTA